jgi:hypothetical protein
MIPGAIFTGLMATDGVIPHFLHAQLGLSPTWILLGAGVALVLCLVLFPAGIAGAWRRRPGRAALRRPRTLARAMTHNPRKLLDVVLVVGLADFLLLLVLLYVAWVDRNDTAVSIIGRSTASASSRCCTSPSAARSSGSGAGGSRRSSW